MKKSIFALTLIVTIVLFGCTETGDPEGLAPAGDSKTGQAYYLQQPLDIQKLATEGYHMDAHWNIFIWPNEHSGVNVGNALNSVEGEYYYIYSYNDRKFYFNPEGPYARYNNHPYYSTKLFSTLSGEYKYGLYMKSKGLLQYGNIAPDTECINRDVNGDNKVDFGDFSEVVPYANSCAVGFSDPCVETYMKPYFGESCDGDSECINRDVNGDGKIDFGDVGEIAPYVQACKEPMDTCVEEYMKPYMNQNCKSGDTECINRDVNGDSKIDFGDLSEISPYINKCKKPMETCISTYMKPYMGESC